MEALVIDRSSNSMLHRPPAGAVRAGETLAVSRPMFGKMALVEERAFRAASVPSPETER